MESVFCFFFFHQLKLLYRLIYFEIKSSVEKFQQNTSEGCGDKTYSVKVCAKKMTQKHLSV